MHAPGYSNSLIFLQPSGNQQTLGCTWFDCRSVCTWRRSGVVLQKCKHLEFYAVTKNEQLGSYIKDSAACLGTGGVAATIYATIATLDFISYHLKITILCRFMAGCTSHPPLLIPMRLIDGAVVRDMKIVAVSNARHGWENGPEVILLVQIIGFARE